MDSSIFGYSLDDFKEEARELLNRAEDIISRIEQTPGDHEDINALFRTIHSLKGSAAYVGLEHVNTFSHLFESFLGDLRQKKYDVDNEVTNLLVRSRDYLEDLVFLSDDTAGPKVNDTILETKQKIADTLSSRKKDGGDEKKEDSLREQARSGAGGATDFGSMAADDSEIAESIKKTQALEKAEEASKEQAAPQAQPQVQPQAEPQPQAESKAPQETKETEEASADMDDQQVITVTAIKSLNILYDILINRPDEQEEMKKTLTKLEETLTWAYGDEADTVVVYIEDIKGLVDSPNYSAEDVERIKGGFNALLNSVKLLIDYKDEPEPQLQREEVEQKTSQVNATKEQSSEPSVNINAGEDSEEEHYGKYYSEDAMDESTSEEILNIAVHRDLNVLNKETKKRPIDKEGLKSVIKKLKEINQWAFDENDGAHESLLAVETLLLREVDENTEKEITIRASVVKSIFLKLLESEEGVTSEEVKSILKEKIRSERESASGDTGVVKEERKTLMPGGIKSQAQGGSGRASSPILRVKQDDIEKLLSSVTDLKGVNQKDLEKLQQNALELRMVPVGELFGRFRKVVRDLSEELDKNIAIEIFGESVKLDKVLADKLNEPMIHLVRNAAGHGIESNKDREAQGKEPAKITLNSYQEGGQIIIEVADNGRGMDVEVIKRKAIEKGIITENQSLELGDRQILECIFAPGFSTKDSADTISGRGVGMDVVKNVISSLHGSVLIETTVGKGTVFRIQLPLTLAIIKAMVLEQGGNKIAVPVASIDRILNMSGDEYDKDKFIDKGRPSLYLSDEGVVLPIASIYENFGLNALSSNRCVVILKVGGGQRVAFIADNAHSRQSLAVKPLDKFSETKFFSSAAEMDDEVVLILNIPSLVA